MNEKKKATDEFTREMGFKSCERTDTPIFNKDELFGIQRPTISMDCKNSSEKIFECTGSIDVNKEKLIKSTCEEKDRK